ncbi:hypothetical protein B0H15DRAFT_289918 [Mycena belliarum]|uniref:Uncharacterized protein n=1 Tax=Mycena belliarum TaxID=1033014 RepID=A0AAD6U2P6_9AGAR|nr:hypothetical protein B0H15DRAFT_289918 [Mycena belliae]
MSSTTTLVAPRATASASTSTSTSTFTATKSSTAASAGDTATPATPTHTTRVRFDAECILIPDTPHAKRPRLLTKSYSLPLWRKGRAHREEDEAHVVLKVALPSFKSKSRTTSRSPPPVAHAVPSCLRASPSFTSPSFSPSASAPLSLTIPLYPLAPTPSTPLSASTSSPAPAPPTLSTISAVYTSAPRSTVVSAATSPAPPTRTVPLRACCPECAARVAVAEEAFSRGAQRVRRRAASNLGLAAGQSSLFLAAQAGGFLSPQRAEEGAGGALMSGTGLAQVNRIVAELERRRASATPSPVGTPPVSPFSTHGRASPSLLGPALARVVEGGGSRSGSASGSGRTSPLPLLPLGIAVDEVDKERRRRSVDLGGLRRERTLGMELLLPEYDGMSEAPASAPPTASAFPFSISGNASNTQANANGRGTPVPAYADDDDAELFPLPCRAGTPRGSPAPTPKGSPAATPSSGGSPAGSELSVHRAGRTQGSPLAPGRETAYTREQEGEEKKAGEAKRERERRSRSEAVCVALGSGGRREREERERVAAMATCARGLLLPPGEGGTGSRESSRSRSGSSESLLAGAGTDEGERERERRDQDKPLPVLPRLAAVVLATGPYSPAIAPRARPLSYHARVASAPAGASSPDTASAPPLPLPSSATPTTPTASTSTSTDASTSISTTAPTATPSRSPPAPPPASPPLRRSSSAMRLRSPSTSSTGRTGRRAFGALVDALKGVTSMSGAPGGGVAV